MFSGYVDDVEAEQERQRKEDALWGVLWDGIQVVEGVLILAVGVVGTPFSAGATLALAALGGSLIVGGVNSAIDHASIASTGEGLNLVGMVSDQVAHWYDVTVMRPAVESGSWAGQLVAGVGSGVGQMISGAAQMNLRDTGRGIEALLFDEDVRNQALQQVTTLVDQVRAGNPVVIGQIVGNILPGAVALKVAKTSGLLGRADKFADFGKPVITNPSRTTSALDWLKNHLGAGGVTVGDVFEPTIRPADAIDGSTVKSYSVDQPGGSNAPGPVKYPTGRLPKRGIPNSFGYDSDGVRLPYANSRPDYAPGQVKEVWNATREKQLLDIEGGEVGAPPSLPGPDQLWVKNKSGDWKLIEWRPGEPRAGLWDMGHLPEAKYAKLRNRYLSHQITKEEFLDEYHDVEKYQVEDPGRNRSHIDEYIDE
ncbi:HNH/ENDO VII family nuclease [Rathayibacter rathayi]|uniref:HNH/ENDO VII family nuclease n=1 Tax=Rathayibacter rathayi TaxID=33887 RepID=UPI000FDB5FE3|nr:HNH/ENDO VII family nuclease [Rathayibacter rathayi]